MQAVRIDSPWALGVNDQDRPWFADVCLDEHNQQELPISPYKRQRLGQFQLTATAAH
jgi:hypothetical protein